MLSLGWRGESSYGEDERRMRSCCLPNNFPNPRTSRIGFILSHTWVCCRRSRSCVLSPEHKQFCQNANYCGWFFLRWGAKLFNSLPKKFRNLEDSVLFKNALDSFLSKVREVLESTLHPCLRSVCSE